MLKIKSSSGPADWRAHRKFRFSASLWEEFVAIDFNQIDNQTIDEPNKPIVLLLHPRHLVDEKKTENHNKKTKQRVPCVRAVSIDQFVTYSRRIHDMQDGVMMLICRLMTLKLLLPVSYSH